MSTSYDIDRVLRLIQAYQHRLKYRIIQTLRVYRQLSTRELADKLRKSKQTVLRQIEELVELELVNVEEIDDGTTPYPKRVYSLNRKNTDLAIRGQEIVKQSVIDQDFIKEYNAYRLATYLEIKHIVDEMLRYQRRMNRISEEGDIGEALEILKDNLGSITMNYVSKRKAALESDIPKSEAKRYEDNSNDYLRIELLIPMRRILEMNSSEEWKKDGTIWFHDI